jgi:propanediol utilization protein
VSAKSPSVFYATSNEAQHNESFSPPGDFAATRRPLLSRRGLQLISRMLGPLRTTRCLGQSQDCVRNGTVCKRVQ